MRSIELNIDLTDAPSRRIVRVAGDLPVTPGTTARFTTPLWICELHTPSGPAGNIAGLFFKGGNRTLRWRRDPVALHIYHVDIPGDVFIVHASFEAVLGAHVTRRMVMLMWESVLLHPTQPPVCSIPVQPKLRIPRGWNYSTALRTEATEAVGDGACTTISFAPVAVERLRDSPVLIGKHLSQNSITLDGKHQLCATFGEPELTTIPEDCVAKLGNLIREAAHVFGPPPYERYKFLSLCSDILAPPSEGFSGEGLEHAESCHLLTASRAFADAVAFDSYGELLSHEYVHVWNGQFRRPAGHVPDNFTGTLDGTLLWVYEGLTKYYGIVLAARSSMSSEATLRRQIAYSIADMQSQSGRVWRSTEDTGTGLALKARPGAGWASWRRGGDYYDEGGLLWLDVDTLIRERSNGQYSLDNFAHKFFDAAGAIHPLVVPYTFEELVATLNETLQHDWSIFFEERVRQVQPQVNIMGVYRAGYTFKYVSDRPSSTPAHPKDTQRAVWHSLGLRIDDDGNLRDVQRHSRADAAGLAPGQTVTQVGGKKYSLHELVTHIELAKGRPNGKIRVQLKHDEEEWEAEVEHSTGLLYPILELRDEDGPDMLAAIFKSRAER